MHLVRVLFPGAGLLVASAWCLGVLNSHGKFLLSYTAPVAWNAAMIATMVYFGDQHGIDWLAMDLAWGSVAGSFLQFAVQAPIAWRLSRHPGRAALTEPVRQALRNFLPNLVSRGAVQLTAYIDAWIASWLPTGAVAALANAQLLYTLPVSLFGISISAAELPAMSGDAAGADGLRGAARAHRRGPRRLAFFVVPSAVAFAALGDVIAGALLQRGRFEPPKLALRVGHPGRIVGRPARDDDGAAVLGRALRARRHEAAAALRAGAARRGDAALGYVCAIVLPPRLGVAARWGAAGLTASAGVAGWIEFALLRASLNRRIGRPASARRTLARLWIAGLAGAAAPWGVRLTLPPLDPLVRGAAVLPAFGAVFWPARAVLPMPVRRDRCPRSRR